MASQIKVKQFFFDRKRVENEIGIKAAKAMIRIGGYIRKTAQNSMRAGTKSKRSGKALVSRPGKPPRAWNNPLLKRMLYFSWDSARKTAVIGPALLRNNFVVGLVPHTHEYGGLLRIRQRNGATRIAHYPPRPFMGPAFAKSMERPVLQAAFDAGGISGKIGPA